MKPWLAFIYCACLGWGTSFLWIKIALEEVGPYTLVLYRVLFGVSGAWILAWLTRKKPNLSRDQWIGLALMGLVNSAIPMTLISWAELHISSGLAGMLNGTLPLFSLILAHLFIPDDKFNRWKISGLVLGFGGVLILLLDDLEHGLTGSVLGQLAMFAAVICYASAGTYTKLKLRGIPPVIMTAVALSSALIAMFVMTLIMEPPLHAPERPLTWTALAWLGLLGMTFAYQALYYLFTVWPVSKISMITYVFPVWSVVLGVVFLDESLTWKLLGGGVLVLAGIVLVNWGSAQTAHK